MSDLQLYIDSPDTAIWQRYLAGGYFYGVTTNPKLLASGAFHLNQGYTHVENVGHVVVVHDSNGIRIGCGVLRNPEELNDFEKNRFINGIEACSEEGKEDGIIAKDEEEGNQR